MSYTPPPTFVAADILEADQLNVLSEDIEYLYAQSEGTRASLVQLSRSTNQAIATGIGEYIVWTAENVDVGGWWSSGDAIIVPSSEIPAGSTSIAVKMEAQLTFAADSTGTRRVRFHVNGSSVGGLQVPGVAGGDTTVVFAGELAEVEAADEIQVEAYENSGGPLNVTAAKVSLWRIGVVS